VRRFAVVESSHVALIDSHQASRCATTGLRLKDQKVFNLCSNDQTRKLRAVQNRAFITIPFSGSTLGVRMGAVAYNLAEAVAALTRNESLPSVSFSEVSITASGGDEGDEGSQQAVSKSGVKVYTRLPVFNGTSLETFCPGTTTQVQVRDVQPDTGLGEKTTSSQSSGLPAWSVALISVLGVFAALSAAFVVLMITREKGGKPLFEALEKIDKEQSVWA
jgi:hypothetical protein